ncbi:MAG: hypothetical protein ABI910_14300 [Gemmatimonadota bacterium]
MHVRRAGRGRVRVRLAVAIIAATPLFGPRLSAQQTHSGSPPTDFAPHWTLGAMAIGVVTHAAPAALGRSVTEGYLTQPMLLAGLQLAGGALQALASVNLEGTTLRRGEINPGIYGEGYIDRRHPHTYLHEAMIGGLLHAGPARLSLFGGKGVVPFGTDDPMTRPFAKYPVNHHLAQVIERVLLVAALSAGPAAVEMARFNGDEPEGPADWPNSGRAFDSWSVRITARTPVGIETSVSRARVESPEFATGQGLDQDKSSASARFQREAGIVRYAMAEWGRTRERERNGRTAFTFSSLLAETSVAVRGLHLSARVERSERPEEDRLDDPYRSVRPLLDFNVLGRTRWEIVTVAVATPSLRRGWLSAAPFVEGAWLRPQALARPAAFDPHVFYDAKQLWSWSAGVRVEGGTMRRRFGRYGAALAAGPGHGSPVRSSQ